MLTPSRQLTDAEKLRKVISELVDTERAYVKVILIIPNILLFFHSKKYSYTNKNITHMNMNEQIMHVQMNTIWTFRDQNSFSINENHIKIFLNVHHTERAWIYYNLKNTHSEFEN